MKVIFPHCENVDLAIARQEFYEYSATTPNVESSSLKQDLGCTVFSVKAIPISLNIDDKDDK